MLGLSRFELKCLYLVRCFFYLLVNSLKPEKCPHLECPDSIKHDTIGLYYNLIENFKVEEGFLWQRVY